LCLHGKRKDYCKECGGSQYCPHGKQRSRCNECKSMKKKQNDRGAGKPEPKRRKRN
jgi:hypothetical protein